jgi:hypothetical protein
MAKRSLNQIKKLEQGQVSKGKSSDKPKCGLCGKTQNLTKTECCGNWICDDEHEYRLFSFAHNSCSRNHARYTLCGSHYAEGHPGSWQDCQACRELRETELYVYFGTNEYNFEKLVNVPKYEPTRCVDCKRIIRLGTEGYSYGKGGYCCAKCSQKKFGNLPI